MEWNRGKEESSQLENIINVYMLEWIIYSEIEEVFEYLSWICIDAVHIRE